MRELYNGAGFKQQNSDKFTIDIGVWQGCVLSPFVFLVTMDSVMSRLETDFSFGIQRRPFEKLCYLDYADDICLLSHKFNEMKTKFDELTLAAASVGLKINFKKTKLMRLGKIIHRHWPSTSTHHSIESKMLSTFILAA